MRVVVFIVSLLLFSCAKKNNNTVVLRNDTSLKLEKRILMHHNHPFTGDVVAYSDATKQVVIYRCNYFKGKKNGAEKKWFDYGALALHRVYQDGMKIGIHKAWWQNGNKKFEYNFNKMGRHHGEANEYFEDGSPYRQFHYHNGKEEGSQKMYKINGDIRANYVVVQGERFGLIGLKKCDAVSTM